MLGQVWARASPWRADRDAGATRPAEARASGSCSGFVSACRRTHTLLSRKRARARRWRGRLLVVLSGSVRHGDWAVARKRFGGGAGVCEAARPRRRTFQFLEVAQCWARGVTGSGSVATSEEPPPIELGPCQRGVSRA